MTSIAASQFRPAILSDVRPPGILLQVGKYGAPFLVAGDPADPDVVFLSGDWKFRAFKRSGANSFDGLAVEDVQFELDVESSVDMSGFRRLPGVMVRRSDQLTLVAISDDTFQRTIEVPIQSGLPAGSEGKAVAFLKWRAFVMVRDEAKPIWETSISTGSEQ